MLRQTITSMMARFEQSERRARKLREACIRLLWRAVADAEVCDDPECRNGSDRLDICDAAKALGFGDHWNAKVFEKKASKEGR